jgi:hypothetical protein
LVPWPAAARTRIAVGQVPHVRVLAAVERDDVLELAEHAERAAGGLASAD